MLITLSQATHLGASKTADLLRPMYYIPQPILSKTWCSDVPFVHKGTPKEEKKPWKESTPKKALLENIGKWNSPMVLRYKYFLVVTDTFSGWMEAYPT